MWPLPPCIRCRDHRHHLQPHESLGKRLANQVGLPKARLHYLRHAAATLMMERGVHPSVVSRSLGHASEAFTMSVYGHVRDEMLDQAADALGNAYGRS